MHAGVQIKAISFLSTNVWGRLNFNFITRLTRIWGKVKHGSPFKMWTPCFQPRVKNHNQRYDRFNKILLEKIPSQDEIFVQNSASNRGVTFLADRYGCLFV